LFYEIFPDILCMDAEPTKIEGYTATQLATLTGKTRHAVESWLSTHSVKPLSEALYPTDTLDRIREARRGRPPKLRKNPE
jgi:hypothetical protein